VQNKNEEKNNPADKTMARMTYVTHILFRYESYPTYAHFLVRPNRRRANSLADGYFCLCRASP